MKSPIKLMEINISIPMSDPDQLPLSSIMNHASAPIITDASQVRRGTFLIYFVNILESQPNSFGHRHQTLPSALPYRWLRSGPIR